MNQPTERMVAATRVRAALVDDLAIVSQSLSHSISQIEPSIRIVFHAVNAAEALQKLESNPVDVVITDIEMPGMGGLDLVRELGRSQPTIRTVVLTMHGEADLVEEAVRAGAWGYVLKSEKIEALTKTILSVAGGERSFNTHLPRELVAHYRVNAINGARPATDLTPRQQEVLKHICDGRTESEIAKELGISHNTVHVHKNNVMHVLGVHSKIDLLKCAVRRKLVQL